MIHFKRPSARHGQKNLSKKGSSLVLVMILSSVLILLGTALLPAAMTAEDEGAKMEKRYEDYFLARAAMEYARGELSCMVQTQSPCTFAVLQTASGFRAVRKTDGGISVNGEYETYIDFDPLGRADDTQDRPKESTAGDQVAAICAVVPTESAAQPFEITICSFVKGSSSLSWNGKLKEGVVP